MDTKVKAAIIALFLVGSSIAGIFLLLGLPGPESTASSFNGDAWINEVHMNSTLSVDEEYFEIYISASYSEGSISGWTITTFDGEGRVALPTISNVDAEDYIVVYTGSGTEDLSAADGTAIVYLGLENRILDSSGDEIAIFDASNQIIHFMRYSGGNSEVLYDNWSASDDGPSLPSGHAGSISYFGQDKENTSAWLESLCTPGNPNQYAFTISETETPYYVIITSGVKDYYSFLGIDDEKESGKNETVDVYPAAGVNESTIKAIKEHIAFSLKFYEGKGFTRGPATYKPGRINVTVSQGTKTEVIGSCNAEGEIVIKLGTIKSLIDLKYVCEHELMHAFQFKTEKDGTDTQDHAPVENKWWIEGQATYWGIESTKANYNLTNKQIQDEFDRVGDHNWYDHYTDLNRSITVGWGGSYSDYIGSYLFNKWISETFGEEKLKEIFDKAKDNYNNNSKDVSPEDAAAEVLGLPWATLLAMFHAWMMSGAITDNGVPERKGHVNVTYSGAETGDSITVTPSGAGVERIKVNSSEPFTMDFKTEPGTVWKITVIYVYEDGSREQAFNTPRTYAGDSAPWPVNPGNHPKKLVEIIVIKTLVQASKPSQINMTITPIAEEKPFVITPNVPESFSLPPGFYNYTDPFDYPWEIYWEFNYTVDVQEHSVRINCTEWAVDSFFDVFIEIEGVSVHEELNIPASTASPHIILWDPLGDWPLGYYNVTIRQSTMESYLNGTIEITGFYPDGWSFDHPQHHNPGELMGQDSSQYRTTREKWYFVQPVAHEALEYILNVDAAFAMSADWYMEIYNPLDSTAPIRSDEGDYIAGEWPRTLSVPTILEPDYSENGYILRVIYEGSEYATGMLECVIDSLDGTSFEKPLWYTVASIENLGLPIPYYGSGMLYINCSVEIGVSYMIFLNASVVDLTVTLFFDGVSAPFIADGIGGYSIGATSTTTGMIAFVIEPGTLSGEILFLWSEII